jgi:group I intron endonuclease
MKVCLVTATKAIYKITSPTGKVYIGQAHDVKRRFREYTYTWKSKNQTKLNASFRKYGPDRHTFEVIHELPADVTQSILDTYEQLYMDLYRDCKVELLNIREAGGRGSLSEEGKEKLRQFHSGKVLSEETKKRISNSRKGKVTGSSNSMYGIGLTGDAKERMRQSKIGKKASEETRRKMSESAKLAHAKRKEI